MSRGPQSTAFVALALALLLAAAGRARAESFVRLGVDLAGDHDETWIATVPSEADMGFSVGLESLSPGSGGSETGFGVEYQMPRGHEVDPGAEFGFLSLYVIARARTGPRRSSAALLLRFGYGLIDGNDDYLNGRDAEGGICYGIGVGFPLQSGSEVQVTYAVSTGTLSSAIGDWDVEYTRLGAAVSLAF